MNCQAIRPLRLPTILGIGFVLMIGLGACSSSTPVATSIPTTPQAVIQRQEQQNVTSHAQASLPTPTLISATLVAAADADQQVLINIYQRNDPSVVNIEIVADASTDQIDSSGSGFVIDADGHILTNAHVIEGAKDILVTFYDGYVTSGKVIGSDQYSDLAVIQVDVPKERLMPVAFGDSSTLKVGQRVIAIGNPFGLLSSMTTGIISATGRTLSSSSLQYNNPSIIQTDAQINPGNSGGPLLDINGQVIGVTTAIRTTSGVFQGVGFAVPSNTVKRIAPQLIKNGKAEYSWLGISAVSGRGGLGVAALADQLQLPVSHGILIDRVLPDSPALDAGLRGGDQKITVRGVPIMTGGDIIVAVNGQSLRDMDELIGYLVSNTAPGDTISLTVIRENKTIEVKVVLKARPPDDSPQLAVPDSR